MYCKLQLQVKGTNNRGVAVEAKNRHYLYLPSKYRSVKFLIVKPKI